MAKNIKKLMAMTLVVCMLVSALPLQALAADGDGTEHSTETSPEGITTHVTTTTSGSGTPTVTVTITKDTNGSYEDSKGNDVTVDRHEETKTETNTAENGTTSEKVTESGSEKKEWSEDVKPGDKVPSVNATQSYETNDDGSLKLDDAGKPIPVKDKEGNIIISGSATGTETTGDKPSGEGDQNYDYTETTTDRTVTGTVGGGVIIEIDTDYSASKGPENYDGKYTDAKDSVKKDPQADGVFKPVAGIVKPGQEQTTDEEGYDFFLSGLGERTDAVAPVFKQIVYQRDENGNPIPDPANPGEYLIDETKSKLINGEQYNNGSTAGGAKESGMDWQASQMILTDKDGEYFYVYCADYLVETDQVPGHLYKLENLEDSGHYNKEDAEKLRAIVLNGYWGNKEGEGSLQSMKDLLTSTYGDEGKITVQDKNGQDRTYTVSDILAGLEEEEALAVTQAAIWAYSINRRESLDGADKVVVVGAQTGIKCWNSQGSSAWSEWRNATNQLENLLAITGCGTEENLAKQFGVSVEELGVMLAAREEAALESDARMKALFECLMAVEGISNTNEEVTTVINENTIQDVVLVVKDKVDEEVNKDDNDDNDKYNAELSFTLAIVPEKDSEDLLVYLCDTAGNVLKDKDGKDIVRRLAGENAEGEEIDGIEADEYGVYTLTGLQLSENVEFDLRLEGTQVLSEGAYLYTAEGGRLASQTLVGRAEGKHDVTVGVTISFEVDENKTVVAQRKWYKEYDPNEEPGTPGTPGEDPVDPWTPPENHRLANDGIEIPEEPVPLATPVITGDNTILWFAMFLLLACGMVTLNLFDKKRKYETF